MNTTESEDGSVGPLREALMVCAAAGMSGILRVTGDPGGAIHIADGRVTAIETPGAPSPEVLLLRSHRVTESAWDEAFAAAASSGVPMGTELTRRDMVPAGELEVLLRTALADAMFVLASGTIEEYRAEQGPVDVVLPLEPGAEPDRLLARMRQAGLLTTVASRAAASGAREPGRGEASAGEPRGASGLPQRQRDHAATSSSWRRPWAPGRAPELRAPLGLLRPRANRDTRPGETS
jgi:hypothetical protein